MKGKLLAEGFPRIGDTGVDRSTGHQNPIGQIPMPSATLPIPGVENGRCGSQGLEVDRPVRLTRYPGVDSHGLPTIRAAEQDAEELTVILSENVLVRVQVVKGIVVHTCVLAIRSKGLLFHPTM
jgi:hypothetical protein